MSDILEKYICRNRSPIEDVKKNSNYTLNDLY